MNWRLMLEPSIRAHLEKQISESGRYREAYSKASNPGNAQLWCAITNLSIQLFNLNLKLAYLEKVLKDFAKPKKVKKKKR